MKKEFAKKTIADYQREEREKEERSWLNRTADPYELATWSGKRKIWNLKPDNSYIDLE